VVTFCGARATVTVGSDVRVELGTGFPVTLPATETLGFTTGGLPLRLDIDGAFIINGDLAVVASNTTPCIVQLSTPGSGGGGGGGTSGAGGAGGSVGMGPGGPGGPAGTTCPGADGQAGFGAGGAGGAAAVPFSLTSTVGIQIGFVGEINASGGAGNAGGPGGSTTGGGGGGGGGGAPVRLVAPAIDVQGFIFATGGQGGPGGVCGATQSAGGGGGGVFPAPFGSNGSPGGTLGDCSAGGSHAGGGGGGGAGSVRLVASVCAIPNGKLNVRPPTVCGAP